MIKDRSQFVTACLVVIVMVLLIPVAFLDTSKNLEYADYIKAIPSLVIGGITAYIAYQQHVVSRQQKNISKNKLNLDLYDKRFSIYEVFLNMSIWSTSIYENEFEPNNLTREKYFLNNRYKNNKGKYLKNIDDLNMLCEQSRFLMNDEVYNILSEARRNIFQARGYADSLYDAMDQKKNIEKGDDDAIMAIQMEIRGYLEAKSESFSYVRA